MVTGIHVLKVLVVICCFTSNTPHLASAQMYLEPCFQPDLPCDAIANLYCSTTGICECQFPWMVFNQAKRLCQVSAGHECDSGSNLMCTENSSCVSVTDGKKECVCDEDFEPCNSTVDDLSSGTEDSKKKVCCLKSSSEEV